MYFHVLRLYLVFYDLRPFFLGAFIIPYCIMSVMAGVPLYIMEVALGQYFAEGPIGTWRIICPLTRGKYFYLAGDVCDVRTQPQISFPVQLMLLPGVNIKF